MSLNNSFVYLPKLWTVEPENANIIDSKDRALLWITIFSFTFSFVSLLSLIISIPLVITTVRTSNTQMSAGMTDCIQSITELDLYIHEFSEVLNLQKLNRSSRSFDYDFGGIMNLLNQRQCCIKGKQGIPGKNGLNGKHGLPGKNGMHGKPGLRVIIVPEKQNCSCLKIHKLQQNRTI